MTDHVLLVSIPHHFKHHEAVRESVEQVLDPLLRAVVEWHLHPDIEKWLDEGATSIAVTSVITPGSDKVSVTFASAEHVREHRHASVRLPLDDPAGAPSPGDLTIRVGPGLSTSDAVRQALTTVLATWLVPGLRDAPEPILEWRRRGSPISVVAGAHGQVALA